jgi:RHS repeat-associated protein
LRYRVEGGALQEADFYIRDQEGNVLSEFLWSPSGEWARVSNTAYLGRKPLVRMQTDVNGDRTYTTLVTDHLDSVRAEVFDADPISPVFNAMDYWPYGELVTHPPALASKHLFTAHEREFIGSASGVNTLEGLDYMHARYYSNSTGRFQSVDPVGGDVGRSQSWNRYGYAMNDPLRYFDPTGRWLADVHLYLTAYLAMHAGLDYQAAMMIGEANVNVDRDRPPLPWNRDDFSLHFMKTEESLAYFDIRWLNPGNEYQEMGMALHVVQDSYAHSLAGWPFGHGFDNLIGESPDDTWRYPEVTMDMAEKTYELLGGDIEDLDRSFLRRVFSIRSQELREMILRRAMEGIDLEQKLKQQNLNDQSPSE